MPKWSCCTCCHKHEPTPSSETNIRGAIRDKVALKPGHSLMDWIRLGNSGKDLTGVGGVMQSITPQELARHNRTEDAWIVIHGIVYNITQYLDFHPGGVEELMKGAGYDATKIFNQIHPWVNYKTILQKCIVGRLEFNEEAIDIIGSSQDLIQQTSKQINNNKVQKNVSFEQDILNERPDLLNKLEIFPTNIKLIHNDGSLIKHPCIKLNQSNDEFDFEITIEDHSPRHIEIVALENNSELLFLIENPKSSGVLSLFHYQFEHEIIWPCIYLKILSNSFHVKFSKKIKNTIYSTPLQFTNYVKNNQKDYKKMEVVSVETVTHDTKLIIFKYCHKIINIIPPGHHIYIKSEKASEISRPYTPIPPCLDSQTLENHIENDAFSIMVKEYTNGILSKELCSLKKGDTILVSGPNGTFNMPEMEESHFLLIAAGTGITPMFNIIKYTYENYNTKMFLLFFNKKEVDILWRDQLDFLSQKNMEKFTVLNILSQAEPSWKGIQGKVSLELLTTHIPTHLIGCRAFICGPSSFDQASKEFLIQIGFQSEKIHFFT